MARRFNTAGICRPEDHYMLAPEARFGELRQLINDKSCFVLHAPRQSGKTTSAQRPGTPDGRPVHQETATERGAMQIARGDQVGQAASSVGYTSVSQFSREFRRLYGEAPRRWGKTARTTTTDTQLSAL